MTQPDPDRPHAYCPWCGMPWVAHPRNVEDDLVCPDRVIHRAGIQTDNYDDTDDLTILGYQGATWDEVPR